jgi:hypothetical protein
MEPAYRRHNVIKLSIFCIQPCLNPSPKDLPAAGREGLGLQLFSINFSYKNYTDRSNLAPSPGERAGERSKHNDIARR